MKVITYPNTKPNHHPAFNVYYCKAICKLFYEIMKQARRNKQFYTGVCLLLFHSILLFLTAEN